MSDDDRATMPLGRGPRRPKVSIKDIAKQAWVDLCGKEVQSAATYSHHWSANQLAHVCLGILLACTLSLMARLLLSWFGCPNGSSHWYCSSLYWGAGLALAGVAVWELRAYRIAASGATGRFPLGRKLLRRNAWIAFGYLALGVAISFTYRLLERQDKEWCAAGAVAVLMAVGIVAAVPWLRMKIIFQKSALPYLFRLADAQPTLDEKAAEELQALVKSHPPAEDGGVSRQVVIGGPIGSGRTSLGVGIGTEFSFNKAMVRYLSLATLLEFAARPPDPDFADDAGPANIGYWRWSQAQVLVIDDVGPLAAMRTRENLEQFRQILDGQLRPIAAILKRCHTVWVIGDLRGERQAAMDSEVLDGFARAIREFCEGQEQALVVQLAQDARPIAAPGSPSIVETEAPRAQMRYVK